MHRPSRLRRLAAVPWFLLASTAAFALALSLDRVLYDEAAVAFPTLLLRVFALIVGAIGTVRYVGRPPLDMRRWLGLPPRDWAFSATFAVCVAIGLWASS